MFDETLRPWLIEINFAPSLACGSPLDLKLKSRVVSDLLTLSGVMPYDPVKMSNVVGKNNRKKKDNYITIGYMGDSRESRGFNLLPDLINRLHEKNKNLRFLSCEYTLSEATIIKKKVNFTSMLDR